MRRLEHDGWVLVATRGSHRRFTHPGKYGRATVAGQLGDDMPKGTLASDFRQAGIESNEQ
jgi:predicted RNA binding protein YcfA (HicA-like mRNA interferase family)